MVSAGIESLGNGPGWYGWNESGLQLKFKIEILNNTIYIFMIFIFCLV